MPLFNITRHTNTPVDISRPVDVGASSSRVSDSANVLTPKGKSARFPQLKSAVISAKNTLSSLAGTGRTDFMGQSKAGAKGGAQSGAVRQAKNQNPDGSAPMAETPRASARPLSQRVSAGVTGDADVGRASIESFKNKQLDDVTKHGLPNFVWKDLSDSTGLTAKTKNIPVFMGEWGKKAITEAGAKMASNQIAKDAAVNSDPAMMRSAQAYLMDGCREAAGMYADLLDAGLDHVEAYTILQQSSGAGSAAEVRSKGTEIAEQNYTMPAAARDSREEDTKPVAPAHPTATSARPWIAGATPTGEARGGSRIGGQGRERQNLANLLGESVADLYDGPQPLDSNAKLHSGVETTGMPSHIRIGERQSSANALAGEATAEPDFQDLLDQLDAMSAPGALAPTHTQTQPLTAADHEELDDMLNNLGNAGSDAPESGSTAVKADDTGVRNGWDQLSDLLEQSGATVRTSKTMPEADSAEFKATLSDLQAEFNPSADRN